jgi:hypothetical protein
MLSPNRPNGLQAQVDELAASLQWRKTEHGWKLYLRGRCFGELIADSNTELPQCTGERGMWRVVLSQGRLSDYANLGALRRL